VGLWGRGEAHIGFYRDIRSKVTTGTPKYRWEKIFGSSTKIMGEMKWVELAQDTAKWRLL
jgi:hypothetical protein